MAEIRVQPKRRSLVWLWLLLVVAVIAAVVWYLYSQGMIQVQRTSALDGIRTAPTTTLAAASPRAA